jgi:hypothetical protein
MNNLRERKREREPEPKSQKSYVYLEPRTLLVGFVVIMFVGLSVMGGVSYFSNSHSINTNGNSTQPFMRTGPTGQGGRIYYGNSVYLEIQGKNIFGWTLAWVKDTWTYAFNTGDGTFVIGSSTFNTLSSGGTWPDGGSYSGAQVCSSYNKLYTLFNYELSSPFNHISGSYYLKLVADTDTKVSVYYGSIGTTNSVTIPPISIGFPEDIDLPF